MTAAPLYRQAAYLLSFSSSNEGFSIESVQELRRSGLLGRLAKSDAQADVTELNRLLVRCDSLVGQDARQGYTLARELLRALPWSTVSSHAAKWVSSGISNLRYAPVEVVHVLDVLLGSASRDRPEYHRAVVAPNLTNYATAMLNAADATQEPHVSSALLGSLAAQVRLHPSSCRPLAPRIHKLCASLLFDRGILIPQATRLLSVLHLTGKGATGTAELWSATMNSVLVEARAAWEACSSTFANHHHEEQAAPDTATTMMTKLPSDPLEALPVAQRRLGLLLGLPPRQGVLPCLLAEATTSPVPVPVGALHALAYDILAINTTSSARQHPPVDANVHAAQVASLAGAHMSAINLLVTVHRTVDRGVCSSRQAETLARLLIIVEGSHYSSAHRYVALKALAILDLPQNPQSRLVLRASRACLGQITRLLMHTTSYNEQQGQASSSSTSRPAKRAKVAYESDGLGLASQERRGLAQVDADERGACMAAIAYLPLVYGSLTTYLTPEHHDLAHTAALVLTAVAEVSIAYDSGVAAVSLRALSQLVARSRGSLLALLMARAGLQGASAMSSPDGEVRTAAMMLRQALEAALHPRLPTRLDLKLQQDESLLPASWTNNEMDGDEEGLKLQRVEIEEQPGSNEANAIEQVLGISSKPIHPEPESLDASITSVLSDAPSANENTTSEQHQSATEATAMALKEHLSPDPVKPLRRPSTPRIGSPSGSPERGKSSLMSGSGAGNAAAAAFMNSVSRNASGAGSPTSALTPRVSSPLASERKLKPDNVVDEDVVMGHLDRKNIGDEDDDDDDEAIPELDLGSSDEEEEGGE